MRWQDYINEQEVRKTISMLKPDGQLFECRVLRSSKKQVISGYFKDADTLLKEFNNIDVRDTNIYITLNEVKAECFSRLQSEHFLQVSQTTNDNEIVNYKWLFVDLDPVRSAGISSSEDELSASKELAKKVYAYLRNMGFEEPVKALSGNGCHLLYRIQLANTAENRLLVEKCLKALSLMFDNDAVKIDTTNSNPARICKLHGTLAQKGKSTTDRPHRMSRIFTDSLSLEITPKVFLQKLAAELPDEPQKEKPKTYNENEFDLLDFMSKAGMRYKVDSNDRATIYRLDECPFDHSHKDGDARIFHYTNGAIAFKCHHNHCSAYKWQDVRLKFEPDAYDKADNWEKYDRGYQLHNRNKSEAEVPYSEITDAGQMFRTAREIYNDPEPDYEYIRSGITFIDQNMNGLQKSGVTVISGLRGSGKSTILGQIINSAIDDGHNVVCYSGELNNKKYLNWLTLQAAGKHNVEATTKGSTVKQDVREKIIDWYGEHFWLFNNKYGNKFEEIERHLRVKLKEYKADLCIIDNLMALDLSSYDRDKYDAQTKFVWALKNLAEITNTHIIFVAHPKKSNGFLRLNDISGSGNISNIVDNAFIVHRWNKDFESGYTVTFGKDPVKDGVPKASNIIEITKDREGGLQDIFIPLFFEQSTKRMRNSIDEYVVYGWEPEFQDAEDMEDIPF